MMGRFICFLNDCILKEVYLHGRHYTWSNEHVVLTLVKLDRVFIMMDLEALHNRCS
jgi:hypothetical protein